MSRRNWTLCALLIVAALTILLLLGLTPPTQAGLFASPLRNYLPLIGNDFLHSPLPTPITYYELYLPIVVRDW